MDVKERILQLIADSHRECPYCGMNTTRISTSEITVVLCGWCECKWVKKDGETKEVHEYATYIIDRECVENTNDLKKS